MKRPDYKKLIISLALPQVAGLVGSLFTAPAIPAWYAGLAKPAFTPPGWIFGPVWTLLYLLMGLSAYLIWRPDGFRRPDQSSLRLFFVHLIFNTSWSLAFFGLKNPGLAFINIIILWLFIVVLIRRFWRQKPLAAGLLLPYLLWVSFAALLNYGIWLLN